MSVLEEGEQDAETEEEQEDVFKGTGPLYGT